MPYFLVMIVHLKNITNATIDHNPPLPIPTNYHSLMPHSQQKNL